MAKLTEEFSTHLDDDLAVEFRRRAADAGCKRGPKDRHVSRSQPIKGVS